MRQRTKRGEPTTSTSKRALSIPCLCRTLDISNLLPREAHDPIWQPTTLRCAPRTDEALHRGADAGHTADIAHKLLVLVCISWLGDMLSVIFPHSPSISYLESDDTHDIQAAANERDALVGGTSQSGITHKGAVLRSGVLLLPHTFLSNERENKRLRWTKERGPLFFFEQEPMILRKGRNGIKGSASSKRPIDETAASIERLARAR